MSDKPPIYFDMLGTFANAKTRPSAELRAYIAHCINPMWSPLKLPDSWLLMPAFDDTKEGFERLRKKYRVFVLSNADTYTTEAILDNNDLLVDCVIDLSEIRRFKPHPECYLHALGVAVWADPAGALMVTANPTFGPYPFGDLEIAGAIGMKTQLIRNPGCPQTIIELAEQLGC